MNRFLWKFGALVAMLTLGMTMTLWGAERQSLIQIANDAAGTDDGTPFRVVATMFVGLLLLTVGLFGTMTIWTNWFRSRPGASMLPAWAFILVALFFGAAAMWAFTNHSVWLLEQDPVPQQVQQGYIAYQTVCMTLFALACAGLFVRGAVKRFRARFAES